MIFESFRFLKVSMNLVFKRKFTRFAQVAELVDAHV